MRLSDEEFRAALREVVERSELSMRQLSAAMGRDVGYVAALLDLTRPSRARPTPADLMAASDATGIPLVELLERLWGVAPARLAEELAGLGIRGPDDLALARLSAPARAEVADFAAFLAAREAAARRRQTRSP